MRAGVDAPMKALFSSASSPGLLAVALLGSARRWPRPEPFRIVDATIPECGRQWPRWRLTRARLVTSVSDAARHLRRSACTQRIVVNPRRFEEAGSLDRERGRRETARGHCTASTVRAQDNIHTTDMCRPRGRSRSPLRAAIRSDADQETAARPARNHNHRQDPAD